MPYKSNKLAEQTRCRDLHLLDEIHYIRAIYNVRVYTYIYTLNMSTYTMYIYIYIHK